MKVGSLFSGIGGFELGFEHAGFEVAWQVEIDPWCRQVLAKHWPSVPRYEDVREVGAHNLAPVDVIIGGFPCQDISEAGKREGIDGARSGLWAEYSRIIADLRPEYAVMENVSALLSGGIDRVLGDLAGCGYDAEWCNFTAAQFGAPHLRERIFIIAYPQSQRWHQRDYVLPSHRSSVGNRTEPNSTIAWNRARFDRARPTSYREVLGRPLVCRMDDGLPTWVDRLRGLGNAVVPQVAQYVAECVMAHAKAQEAQAA